MPIPRLIKIDIMRLTRTEASYNQAGSRGVNSVVIGAVVI
jgi:hypothetical protein